MEPIQPPPIARWNPARDVWETDLGSLLCEHSVVYSETFPTSGTWADGMVYELPMSAPHMDGSESSLLPILPTPSVADGMGGHLTRSGDRSTELLLPGVAKALALLPTPQTSDTNGPGEHGTGGPDLRTVVSSLPQPAATTRAATNETTQPV